MKHGLSKSHTTHTRIGGKTYLILPTWSPFEKISQAYLQFKRAEKTYIRMFRRFCKAGQIAMAKTSQPTHISRHGSKHKTASTYGPGRSVALAGSGNSGSSAK